MAPKALVLRCLIYLTGAVSVFVFCLAKSPDFLATHANLQDYTDHGGIYRISQLNQFEQPFTKTTVTLLPAAAEDAEVFLIGDSFSEYLFDAFVTKINRPTAVDYNHVLNPNNYLRSHGVKYSDKRRYLVLQRVDRYIDRTYLNPKYKTFQKRIPPNIRTLWFEGADRNYQRLAQYYPAGWNIMGWWRNIRYRFGILPAEVPLVSADGAMGFHEDSVHSVFRRHSDADINRLVGLFSDFATELDQTYNIQLIVMPVPNKFTVYRETTLVAVPYDNFIDRLSSALEAHGIPVIHVLENLMASSQLTYWPNDTHWNQQGLEIAATAAAETLETVASVE